MSDYNDDVEREHSKRGPSSAHRWRRCPGSVRLTASLPDTAGVEAAIGTVFHEFAAMCLEFDLEPYGFVGDGMEIDGFGFIEFTRKMADDMLAGLDFLRSLANVPNATMIVERRVSLKNWVGPNEFGTTDCVIIDPSNSRMIVFDWKYGAGVPVQPTFNDQVILYGLGAWDDIARDIFENEYWAECEINGVDYELDHMPLPEVWVVIEQPRASGGGGIWKTDMGTLLRVGEQIRIDAKRTEAPDAPIIPGKEQCKFCAAAKHGVCKERARFALDLMQIDFDEMEEAYREGETLKVPLPKAFTPEARSQVLLHRSLIEAMLKDLWEDAERDARHGRPVPGMKLVEGRNPARKWKDEEKAEVVLEARLGEKAYTKKLTSPTQVEEIVGKKVYGNEYARLVDKGTTKSILVPDSHPGEALKTDQDDFDEMAEESEIANLV